MFAVAVDADRKNAKTEPESLVAPGRTIYGSDGKKDGEDESKSSAVRADGDNNLV